MTTLIVFLLYAIGVWFHWGIFYADAMNFCGVEYANRIRRENASFSLFLSLIAFPSWVVCPFATGFYQHGWMMPFSERAKNHA